MIAVRQNKLVTENILTSVCDGAKMSFVSKPLGVLDSPGLRFGAAEALGFWVPREVSILTKLLPFPETVMQR